MSESRHEEFLREAVALAGESVNREGTQPFGAVVVKDGRIVGRGINQSGALLDPTSHGETEAIRDACRTLGTLDLSGTTLYASCEPCPICRATVAATRIAAVYYAVSSEEANDILSVVPPTVRRRSDIARMRAIAGGGGDLPTTLIETPGAREVLRRWAEHRSG